MSASSGLGLSSLDIAERTDGTVIRLVKKPSLISATISSQTCSKVLNAWTRPWAKEAKTYWTWCLKRMPDKRWQYSAWWTSGLKITSSGLQQRDCIDLIPDLKLGLRYTFVVAVPTGTPPVDVYCLLLKINCKALPLSSIGNSLWKMKLHAKGWIQRSVCENVEDWINQSPVSEGESSAEELDCILH